MRVLVVDDDPGARDVMRLTLELDATTDMDVETIAVWDDAWTDWPDVVVCDLMMPDVDGAEVMRRLRAARGASVRLILCTHARPTPDELAKAFPDAVAMADAIMSKLSMRQLVTVVTGG